MKTDAIFARKTNQKLAYAKAVLALPDDLFTQFVGQPLLQGAFLQMESAIAFFVAEVVSRHKTQEVPPLNEALDGEWIRSTLEQSQDQAYLGELRQLLAQPRSWLNRCLQASLLSRSVGENDVSFKSPLFDLNDGSVLATDRIAASGADDIMDFPDRSETLRVLSAIIELVERQRHGGEEY